MSENNSNAANIQQKPGKAKPRGKPFVKGDERINRDGRKMPKDQRELNALLDEIFAEEIAVSKTEAMSKLRAALNRLLLSKNPSGVIHILERRYGKIPQAVDVTSGGKAITWKQLMEMDDTDAKASGE